MISARIMFLWISRCPDLKHNFVPNKQSAAHIPAFIKMTLIIHYGLYMFMFHEFETYS